MLKIKSIFLTLFLLGSLSGAAPLAQKIIGGEVAKTGEFPFIVSLQDENSKHFCGGALVHPGWVLTAAHCVNRPTFKIVTGLNLLSDLSTSETFEIKKVFKHPHNGKPRLFSYDMALIQLQGESKADVVNLNKIDLQNLNEPLVATVAGWGTTVFGVNTKPDQLMRTDVPLVDTAACLKSYPGRIDESMLCAGFIEGGKDACQGDSGGPLVYQNKNGEINLVGVVSWGTGCAKPKFYGVYGKVSYVTAWIEQTIRNNSKSYLF